MAKAKFKVKIDINQPIFVGIDVHKNKWAVSIIHQDVLIAQHSIPGKPEMLLKLIEKFDAPLVYTVYEAGFSGFHLHFALQKAGIQNIVVSPNKIPYMVGDLVKTDKRDSKKLAISLSKGLLSGINIPSPSTLNIRQLVRSREIFKKKRLRSITQIKMILFQYGINLPSNLSNNTREIILSLDISPFVLETCKDLIEEVDFYEKKIRKFEKLAHQECQNDPYQNNYKILQTIPGIGSVIAAALCVEIGDWTRFSNASKLAAFLGLTPREYSSGEKVYRGRITRQGNPWLRSYLVEACWKTIGKDPAMKSYYNKVKSNTGSGKKAIVAVARKLVHRMHSLIKNNQCYSIAQVA